MNKCLNPFLGPYFTVILLKFPHTLVDKCCLFTGASGTQIQVITNYFNLEQAPDWHLYQYHVDFNPPVESKRMRIALLCSHEDLIGKTKAFDGMVLFLPIKLQNQVPDLP